MENSSECNIQDILRYTCVSELAYVKKGWDEFDEFKRRADAACGDNTYIPFYKDNGSDHSSTDSLGGCIIVSELEVIIAFRGTEKTTDYASEWYNDLDSHPRKVRFGQHNLLVHHGAYREFERSKLDLFQKLSQINFTSKSIVFTGHSLGAICQLAALDLLTNNTQILNNIELHDISIGKLQYDKKIKIVTFGGMKLVSTVTYGSYFYQYMKANVLGSSYNKKAALPLHPNDFIENTIFNSIINIRVRFNCDPVPHYPLLRTSYTHINNVDMILQHDKPHFIIVDHPIKSYRIFLQQIAKTNDSTSKKVYISSKFNEAQVI